VTGERPTQRPKHVQRLNLVARSVYQEEMRVVNATAFLAGLIKSVARQNGAGLVLFTILTHPIKYAKHVHIDARLMDACAALYL
jgi:hypothetical protein